MKKCVFINTPPLDVFRQMAVDEALITKYLPQDICMARFFNWGILTPAATFGYAQFEDSAAKQIAAAGIEEYTRRPTGGGVVIHKDDLTFSLFFREEGNIKPSEIYARLHSCIKREFVNKGFALSTYDKNSDYRPAPGGISSDCFTNPVSDDLLGPDGGKILGGAIRRFNNAVLYQGSLQLREARNNEGYKDAVSAGILNFFSAGYEDKNADNALLNEAYGLAAAQYRTREWKGKF